MLKFRIGTTRIKFMNKVQWNLTYSDTSVPRLTDVYNIIPFVSSSTGNVSADTVIRSTLNLHKNIVSVNIDDEIHMVSMAPPTKTTTQDQLMNLAAQHLILTLYRNQLMHIFTRVAMVSLSINASTEDYLPIGKKICFATTYMYNV